MASGALSATSNPTQYQLFEYQIRYLSERIAKAPNDRKPVQEALVAIRNNFPVLLTTDNKAIDSYNIVAGSCDAKRLARIQKNSNRVEEELKQIESPDDASAALKALDEVEKPSSTKSQGWGSWFWNQLPGFVKALVNRVMGWSNEEKQQFREGLKQKVDSKKQS